MWGAIYSLDLAWRDGHRKVVLEIDSIATISLISVGSENKHPYAMVITRVHDLLCRDWQVRILHVYREANRVADCLANLGHTMNFGICYFLHSPSCLVSILGDDLVGVALPRLVA